MVVVVWWCDGVVVMFSSKKCELSVYVVIMVWTVGERAGRQSVSVTAMT
jgi:hypothetical protein